jgi:hypothetical protein
MPLDFDRALFLIVLLVALWLVPGDSRAALVRALIGLGAGPGRADPAPRQEGGPAARVPEAGPEPSVKG